MMKKICYIVTLPLTIKAFFIPQIRYLAENGYDVTVICNDDLDIRKNLGNNIYFVPVDIPRGISITGSIKAIKQLISVFKKENFDLIQYSTPNAALYSAIASKLVGCKIRNYHCMGFRYLGFSGLPKKIFKFIEKITCTLSTDIECVSNSNLELGIKEKLFNDEKATVVFHGSTGGVDMNKFNIEYRNQWRTDIRNKYSLYEDDFVYGFVGRITRDKGINELLEAFFSLKNNSKLMLIGNMEENNNLDKSLLEKSKHSVNIIYTGAVDDVEKYFAAIDVLVLPSYREGFGNVVIESEAMGTPVIVNNIPGPIDAMENDLTGKIVEKNDINSLKEKMIEIEEEYENIDYRNNCFKYANEYFNDKVLCQEILKRKEKLLNK